MTKAVVLAVGLIAGAGALNAATPPFEGNLSFGPAISDHDQVGAADDYRIAVGPGTGGPKRAGANPGSRPVDPNVVAPQQHRDVDRDVDVDVDVDVDDDERDYLIEDDTARGFVAGTATGAAIANSNDGSSSTNTCPDENNDGICDDACVDSNADGVCD